MKSRPLTCNSVHQIPDPDGRTAPSRIEILPREVPQENSSLDAFTPPLLTTSSHTGCCCEAPRPRSLAWTFFVLLLAIGLTSTPARGDTLPAGSYQQTCKNSNASGGTLTAQCKDNNQNYQPTSALTNYQQCIGDIQNLNGQLQCNKGGTTPPGSYQQSCRDIYVNGTTLYATCKTRDGGWSSTPTSLSNTNQCIGGVLNIDGVLRCSMGEAPPNGSYMRSCTDEWEQRHSSCYLRRRNRQAWQLRSIGKCQCVPGRHNEYCWQPYVPHGNGKPNFRKLRADLLAGPSERNYHDGNMPHEESQPSDARKHSAYLQHVYKPRLKC